MRRRAPPLPLVALLLAATPVSAQTVLGVDLGKTPAREVLATRGPPTSAGAQDDGWEYLAYRLNGTSEVFYFSAEDSLVEWARVFLESGRSVSRVREAFGRPDTTQFGDDLTKLEVFRGGAVVVAYDDQNTAKTIEYHPYVSNNLGHRRYNRATAVLDTLMAKALMPAPCDVNPCPALRIALDSVFRLSLGKRTASSPELQGRPIPQAAARAAAVYDSLCTVVDCVGVRGRLRALDNRP